MRDIRPVHSKTTINPRTREWVCQTFSAFTTELEYLVETCRAQDSLVVFRGHAKRDWLLDSTYIRSIKARLFGIPPEARFTRHLAETLDLHRALLNLLLLKFGVLVRPTDTLEALAATKGIDSWFELLRRLQQYPEEDQAYLRGTHIIDWTQSFDIGVYFANENRSGDGALFVCDATATGRTLQTIPVGEILEKMDTVGNGGGALGTPLLFHPERQIKCLRANNQQAVYFAQMDLRSDLESQWRALEANHPKNTVLVKLVLPGGTEEETNGYLRGKGIVREFVFPPEV